MIECKKCKYSKVVGSLRGCFLNVKYDLTEENKAQKISDQYTVYDIHRMRALNKNGDCKHFKIKWYYWIIKN